MAQGVPPSAKTVLCPLADGGDGTMAILVQALKGRFLKTFVHDPLGKKRPASWGWVVKKKLAVVELAEASGLRLLKSHQRNPTHTSTFGTGELLRAALDKGAKTVILGLGGSATVDGGTGLAQALGVEFFDKYGQKIFVQGGGMLDRIAKVSLARRDRRLKRVRLIGLCDVQNPLTGSRGAARAFGPQKGASAAQVKRLEKNLEHLARIIRRDLHKKVQGPGTGVAGGAGAGFLAFCGAKLVSGSKFVLQMLNVVKYLKTTSLVITGEGRMDRGTLEGKAPRELAQLAQEHKVPVLAVCGSVAEEDQKFLSRYFHLCPIGAPGDPKSQKPSEAQRRIQRTVARAFGHFLKKGLL